MSEFDNLSPDVKAILYDLNNQLYISSLVVIELVQLYQLKKIQSKNFNTAQTLVESIEKEYFIKIKPFAEEHTLMLCKLNRSSGHNDPFDHAIIAHAITEKLTLVSSDRKFQHYIIQGLDFVFNKR